MRLDYLTMLVFKLIHVSNRGPRLYSDKWNDLSFTCTTNKDHIYYQATPDFLKTFYFHSQNTQLIINCIWQNVCFVLFDCKIFLLVLIDYQPFYHHAPVMHSHTTRSNFVWSTGLISIQRFDCIWIKQINYRAFYKLAHNIQAQSLMQGIEVGGSGLNNRLKLFLK